MEYQGYYTKEEIIDLIEETFPFINKPDSNSRFVFDENDIMVKILTPKLDDYTNHPNESDVCDLISFQVAEWIFPRMLRTILKGKSEAVDLIIYFVGYFDNMDNSKSGYDFRWLNIEQIKCLNIIFEYLSETYNESVAIAQENLQRLPYEI